MRAIRIGATRIYTLLINRGARLNDVYIEPPGTALAAAIEKGNVSLFFNLLQMGATALSPKLERIGNISTALYLERIGSIEPILRLSGHRILVSALSAGNDRLVHWLLYRSATIGFLEGSDLAVDDQGAAVTALQTAINSRHLGFAWAFLDTGAKVTDHELSTAIRQTRNGDATELFLELLGRVTNPAPTAFAAAIVLRQDRVLQLLLSNRIDPTGTPDPLDEFWEQNGHSDLSLEGPQTVLELLPRWVTMHLLEDLGQLHVWDGVAIGRALVLSIVYDRQEMPEWFLGRDVEVNQVIIICHMDGDDDGEPFGPVDNEVFTPFQAAAKYQRLPVLERLLDHPNININDLGNGLRRRTVLQHAVDNANMDIVNVLLRHGANINSEPASDGGATALQLAAVRGYIGIAKHLIDLGADVDAPPAEFNERSAMEGAVENGRIDMLQMLVDASASVTGELGDRQYRRALHLAERNGHLAAARGLTSFKHRLQQATRSLEYYEQNSDSEIG
ncbi:ankyrin repeat-containing domain protein [Aspergillus heterothallicus]